MKWILLAIVVAVTGAAAWLLTRPAAPKNYVDDYHQALKRFPGSSAAIELGLEHFERAFANLAHAEISERIAALYAPELYFNDTLKTFGSRKALVAYMQRTSARLERSKVTIESVMRDGSDVFVRWTMEFRTRGASGLHSMSIGISHLRFDDHGQVVVHQDFWDPAAGLYRNMPVLGYALDKVDQRMTRP